MRRHTRFRSLVALVLGTVGLGAGAATSSAGGITYAGNELTYTAAPGESNSLSFFRNTFEITCGELGTPCLQISDTTTISAPPGLCEVSESGRAAYCRLPASMVLNLGDGDDGVFDWNGPSRIDMGPGNDALADGNGGDDVILGGPGNDIMKGHAGNDTLDGGPGNDHLEGIPGSSADSDTSGTDTYVGGGGEDSLTYETRGDPLAISQDGVANDGAPGEGDSVDPSIRNVVGGGSDDTLIGSEGRNVLEGLGGNDRLLGLAGDDQLVGGLGNDDLLGGEGQDVLGGEDGDDVLDGGAGVDRFYGDEVISCIRGCARAARTASWLATARRRRWTAARAPTWRWSTPSTASPASWAPRTSARRSTALARRRPVRPAGRCRARGRGPPARARAPAPAPPVSGSPA